MYQITRPEDGRFAWRMFSWQKSRKCSIYLYAINSGGGEEEQQQQLKIQRPWKVYFKLAKHSTDTDLFRRIVENMCIKEYEDLYEIKAYFECIDRDLRRTILFDNTTIQCHRHR